MEEGADNHAPVVPVEQPVVDERGLSRAADTIYRFQHGLMNYRSFPPEFWKKTRTTNLVERINKELKRRSRKLGAFPSDASLLRLAGSILIDINDEWITGSRYLSAKSEMICLDTVASDFTATQRHDLPRPGQFTFHGLYIKQSYIPDNCTIFFTHRHVYGNPG